MNAVSLEPFKGMSDEQIIEEARRLQESKGKQIETRRTTETIEEQCSRIMSWVKNPGAESEAAERRRKYDEDQARQLAESRWREANVPPRHANAQVSPTGGWGETFARLQGKKADSLIALVGINGNGKTQMAVEMIRKVTHQGRRATYTTATGFLMDVKRCYRDEARTSEEEIVSKYSNHDLLVIDEIHRRKGSDWENSLLFEVIDRMYRRERMVIVIANQTQQEFASAFGDSLVSRMNETGGVIECNWPSFREDL